MENYVFISLTTYQLLVADCYARRILTVEPNAYVLVISVGLGVKPNRKTIPYSFCEIPDLNKNKFLRIWKRLYWGGNLFCFAPIRRWLNNKGRTRLFVFNDNEPITHKAIEFIKNCGKNRVILIDEGIGTYAETSGTHKTVGARKIFTSIIGSPMQYKAIGDNPLIDIAIVQNINLYCKLKKAKNQKVIMQDKRRLYVYGKDFLKSYYKIQNEVMNVDLIYLGDVFDEYGRMNYFEYKFLRSLFSGISDRYSILIKPHPRDSKDKYDDLLNEYNNVKIVPAEYARIPIEILIGFFDTNYVLSFNSSASINLLECSERLKSILLFKTDFGKELYNSSQASYMDYDDDMIFPTNDRVFYPHTIQEVNTLIGLPSDHTSGSIITNNSENADVQDEIKVLLTI